MVSNGLSIFFINYKQTFINDPKILPRNPPDCTILDNLVFDNFTLADEIFGKPLQSFETFISVSNNLSEK